MPGYDISPLRLIEFLESRLARYELPGYLLRMEALSCNGAGKLVKAQLRKTAGAER